MAGDLVIAGGGLAEHASRIFQRFCSMAGGMEFKFAILPSASAQPEQAARKMRATLESLGVPPHNIEILPISPLVPEWSQGAWEQKSALILEQADGLWITGGDQSRILQCLIDSVRGPSPCFEVLRRRSSLPYAEGGLVVGGSSAGAAVMSDPMICGGTSWGALSLPLAHDPGQEEISEPLCLGQGLGLFPEGIVDQHFDTRARFARLMTAAMQESPRRLAFGVDEDTALIYEGSTRCISVMGKGGVSVIDTREARIEQKLLRGRMRTCISGVLWHYLVEGDTLELAEHMLDFSLKKEIAPSDAALRVPGSLSTGPLSPYGALVPFAVHMLLDNDPQVLEQDELTGQPCVRGFVLGGQRGDSTFDGWELDGWELALIRRLPASGQDPASSDAGGTGHRASIKDPAAISRLFLDSETNRAAFCHVSVRLIQISAIFR